MKEKIQKIAFILLVLLVFVAITVGLGAFMYYYPNISVICAVIGMVIFLYYNIFND